MVCGCSFRCSHGQQFGPSLSHYASALASRLQRAIFSALTGGRVGAGQCGRAGPSPALSVKLPCDHVNVKFSPELSSMLWCQLNSHCDLCGRRTPKQTDAGDFVRIQAANHQKQDWKVSPLLAGGWAVRFGAPLGFGQPGCSGTVLGASTHGTSAARADQR